MKCIFCKQDKKASKEHIISECIGGIVTVKNVCIDCNSKLGAEVDSELNRQRHIYDAYLELRKQHEIDLEFHFSETYFEDELGNKIKFAKSQKGNKINPTKTEEGVFVIDHSDTEFIENRIKRIAKKQGISEKIARQKIVEYLYFNKFSKPGDIYVDEIFDIIVKPEKKDRIRKTIMSGNTPHRFLAKAYVEFCHLLLIQDEIENLEALRLHALNGDKFGEIECFEQIRNDTISTPIHLIQFTPHQFHIHFFMKYATSININWKRDPLEIYLGNDVSNKCLRILLPDKENKNIELTNYVLNFHALQKDESLTPL